MTNELKYDPELPFAVIEESGQVSCRFRMIDDANYWIHEVVGAGQAIDTTPKPKIPEDAEFIYYTSWSNSGAYARRIGHAKNNDWETSNPTSRVDEEDLLKRIGDAEVTVLVRKEGS